MSPSFGVPSDPKDLRKLLSDLLGNPHLLPPSLLSYLNDYNALNQAPIPAGQIIGISNYLALVDSDMTDVSVVSTASETSIYSLTVPPNFLGTENAIRVDIAAEYTNNTGSNQTLVMKVKYGATTVWADTSVSVTTSANSRGLHWHAIFGANESATAQKITGAVGFGDGNAADTGYGPIGNTGVFYPFGGTSAENSATKLTLDFRIKHSVSNAALDFTKHFAYATRIAH